MLYRSDSEEGRVVESFIHDFRKSHDVEHLEVLDIVTREGSAMATLYDVMRYPAILALRDDGSVLRSWEGVPLPMMDELAYYTFS